MTSFPPNDPGDAIDDAEWQAQERAMRALRDRARQGCDTHAETGYQQIAQALRDPPTIDLPGDFAADVARRAGENKVLAFDMGGTTAKVCLIDDFEPDHDRIYEEAVAKVAELLGSL